MCWPLWGLGNAVDSLKGELAEAGSDTARARLSNRIGAAFFYSNMDSALVWWTRGLRLGEALAASEDSSERRLGQRAILSSSNNMAVVAQYRGLYPVALRNYQRCIRIAMMLNDKRGLLNALNNIGIIKKDQRDFQEALRYFRGSQGLAVQIADSHSLGTILNNIGTVLLKMNRDGEAMGYFRRSHGVSVRLGDRIQAVDNLINIASIHLEGGNGDSALHLFEMANGLAVEAEYELGRPSALLGMGKAYHLKGEKEQALEHVEMAYGMARELDLTEELVSILEFKAELQSEAGQHAVANGTLGEYIRLKDSLFAVDKALEFGQLEASFDYEREEYEASLRTAREDEAQRKRFMRQYLIALGCLCGVVMLMLVALRFAHAPGLRKVFILAALLFFFEFLLVVLDSVLDARTGGLPVPKLLLNVVLAAGIAPLHGVLERWLSGLKRGSQ